ncbi:MAG: dihydroorotate dehydrogenase electron transfer subunit [Oscillospiraceae bacterium]|jgi:dihydroorotate dehydrogenase electron transfer subunit|nr:dihydroorotate dehydrogenase electron transfer subunit [Oscillospiraceae bacterium]
MTGVLLSTALLAEGVVDWRVQAALDKPAPGRFAHLAVPGFSLRRPISLCGYEDGVARLVFAVRGRGTAALADLRPGEEIELLGALGNGYDEAFSGKTLLVGGGVGLPPLLYYAKRHPETHTIAGCRTSGQVVLVNEFPSADLCTDDGSAGFRGFPHQLLEARLSAGERVDRVLACGPPPLLRAVADVCGRYGIPCFVSMEERMGCGVGACLVCACAAGGRYRRVCKDGPVFDAAEVSWEEVPV